MFLTVTSLAGQEIVININSLLSYATISKDNFTILNLGNHNLNIKESSEYLTKALNEMSYFVKGKHNESERTSNIDGTKICECACNCKV